MMSPFMEGQRAAIRFSSRNWVHFTGSQFVRCYKFLHWHKFSSCRHSWFGWLLNPLVEISKSTATWERKERDVQKDSSTRLSPSAIFSGFVLIWVYKYGFLFFGFFLPKLFMHILTVFALAVLIPGCFEGTNVFHGMSCVRCADGVGDWIQCRIPQSL